MLSERFACCIHSEFSFLWNGGILQESTSLSVCCILVLRGLVSFLILSSANIFCNLNISTILFKGEAIIDSMT